MVFESCTGQERAAEVLRAQLRVGWIPHALLFVGPEGVGRLKMARELAKALLCDSEADHACGVCRSCRQFDHGNHPDYAELGIPEGRQSLPIDSIRRLQREASMKPLQGSSRVFIIRDAERMTTEAANCFLKTLEEPPGNCYLILLATGLRNIPDTIVSRCQLVKLSCLPPSEVESRLVSEGMIKEDSRWLARRCWGSPGRARDFSGRGMPELNRELCTALARLHIADNFRLSDRVREIGDEIARDRSESRMMLQELLECMATFYRDAAALSLDPEAELFNESLKEELQAFSADHDMEGIIDAADKTLQAVERIGANANSRLVLDDLFTTLSHI